MPVLPSRQSSPALADPSRVLLRGWIALILLSLACMLNYLDRQTLSILKETLKGDLRMSDTQYSHLVAAFMIPYIVCYVISGRIVDRVGTRWATTAFISCWSLANLACGFAVTLPQLGWARTALGVSEPGLFPSVQRSVSTWFPKDRQAFAFSLTTASPAIGAVIAPPFIALLTTHFSWHAAFIIPGIVGLGIAVVWWFVDQRPAGRDRDGPTMPIAVTPLLPWRQLLRDGRLWGLLGARMITDPVLYFTLFWVPGFIQERLGLSLSQLGWVGWIPPFAAAVCVMTVGRWSDARVGKLLPGHDPLAARMRLFTVSACLAPIGALMMFAPTLVFALAIISVITAIAQVWFMGYGVIIAELFPQERGLGQWHRSACGATGGLLLNLAAPALIKHVGYYALFAALACLHPLGAFLLNRTVHSNPPRRLQVA